MKVLQIICLSALLSFATGCKKETETPSVQQMEQGTLPSVETDTVQADTISKTNKISWNGKYSGNLTCGDCAGIKTEITLNADKTYTLLSQYTGKGEPVTYNGTYSLDEATQVVTLDAEGDHLKFKIIDDGAYGMLKKLDKFGADEQGGPAARYLLHKVQ